MLAAMHTLKTIIAALFSLLAIQSCYAADDQVKMYVLVPPEKATVFTKELASVVEQLGLKAQFGDITNDGGHTLYALEAMDRGMRVWSQNVYVTTRADPGQCGDVVESYPDPGQYVVFVESSSTEVSETSAAKLAEDIRDSLTDLGYEVMDDALICSPWAKSADD